MNTISAVIITKNATHSIKACLDSISWVDEIIVVDANSTDNTAEICRNFSSKVKVLIKDWLGFGQQKNYALTQASSDWILCLDADERVSDALREEILTTINNTTNVAFKIPRLTYFLGRAITHCFNPKGDQVTRLIKKNCGKFTLDAVHEKLVPKGTEGLLKNYLLHTPFQNCAELMEKTNRYSTLGVENLLAKKVKPGIAKTFGHALWTFIRLYFIKLGMLDGWPGFLIAFSSAEGVFYRYAKLLELSYNNYHRQEKMKANR